MIELVLAISTLEGGGGILLSGLLFYYYFNQITISF